MPARKESVSTPLHLLQQLSQSLVVHLRKACTEAQNEAEGLLANLEKQRGKTQEKVIKARAKLDEAGNAGKSKAQAKARAKLSELDDMLAVLQARQNETLNYLSELKRDAEQSLKLAQGITQVENAAAQALASRGKPDAARSSNRSKGSPQAPKRATAEPAASKTAAARSSSRAARPATNPSPKTTAAKNSAAEKPVAAKAPASTAPTRKAPSGARRRPASNAGKPTSAADSALAAKPSVAKKPARKPAAAKGESAAQSSPIN